MGSGFSKMKKQARALQEQMGQMRTKMQTERFEGTAGAGLVTVTLNGEKSLTSLKINPDCVDPKDVEGLQDLILAAFRNAEEKQEKAKEETSPFPF